MSSLQRSWHAALVVLTALGLSGCVILDRDDLVPAFGKPCDVDKTECAVEHTCVLTDPGQTKEGVCVPVQSYGSACDRPTWPPGRLADIKQGDVTISTDDQFPLIEDKRAVTGMLRVYREAAGEQFTVPSLCIFRALQGVGNTFVLAKTNVATFDGLQTLTSVHGGFAIFGNRNLENLDALGGLMEV